MKTKQNIRVVLVTTPTRKVARELAANTLRNRLAACVNILPSIESHFWWQGELESGREFLLIFKTTQARLKALEQMVLRLHPYDTPEFLVLNADGGARRYCGWIAASVRCDARVAKV